MISDRLKVENAVTVDGCRHFRRKQMATHAVVNFTLDSPGVLNTALVIPAKARDYVFTGVGLSVCLFVTTITK